MIIQVNTDRNIEGRESLTEHVNKVIESALSRISDRITRVEVHLGDENGEKKGQNDKRCILEARLKGSKPVAVTHQDSTLDQALDGAINKLLNLIDSTLGRLHTKKRQRTDPPLHVQEQKIAL